MNTSLWLKKAFLSLNLALLLGHITIFFVGGEHVFSASQKSTSLDLSKISTSEQISLLSLVCTIFGAYLAFESFRDTRQNKLFDELRNYLLAEIDRLSELIDEKNEEIEGSRERITGLEKSLESHEKAYGHDWSVDALLQLRQELLELKSEIKRLKKDRSVD